MTDSPRRSPQPDRKRGLPSQRAVMLAAHDERHAQAAGLPTRARLDVVSTVTCEHLRRVSRTKIGRWSETPFAIIAFVHARPRKAASAIGES